MNNLLEIWKDIPDYKGFYRVSNMGKIKRLIGNKCKIERILKQNNGDKYGHLTVLLSKNGVGKHKYVHRLVLEAFIGICPKGMECRHLDGNPKNNKLDNLCWGTRSDNQKDSVKHKTKSNGNQKRENNNNAKLNNWKVRIINRLLEDKFLTQKDIAQIFNTSQSQISNIKNNKIWNKPDA